MNAPLVDLGSVPPPSNPAFVPGTYLQWAWDASTLGPAKQCPRQYFYGTICGYALADKGADLDYGSLMALGTGLWFIDRANGVGHEEALRKSVKVVLEEARRIGFGSHEYKNIPTMVRSLVWYLDAHATDEARTLVDEHGPLVECHVSAPLGIQTPHRQDAPPRDAVWFGYVDRLVQLGEEIWIGDLKTTKNTVGDDYFKRYELHLQLTGYYGMGLAKWGTQLRGVMVDALQNAVNFARWHRHFLERTPEQMDEWHRGVTYYIRRIWDLATGRDPGNEANWPQNEEACFLCQFRSICKAQKQIRPSIVSADYVKRTWNPAQPRHPSMTRQEI